jgi:hypothetical protein
MTERLAHQAWSDLIMKHSTAARLMHLMVAQMGAQNALVISQPTLAGLMKCHVRTVQRAIDVLVEDRWVQRVTIGGTVHGYIINDQVAWCEKRAMKEHSVFTGAIVASRADQQPEDLTSRDLRRLPMIYQHEDVSGLESFQET